MKLKRFDHLNEDIDNENKARKKGYNIGDTVYNHIMQKRLIIAPKYDRELFSGDKYCTLGAVGEFPENYTKISSSTNDPQRARLPHEINIKKAITDAYNKALIPKEELKSFINDFIDKM